jgi:hypothetical protein
MDRLIFKITKFPKFKVTNMQQKIFELRKVINIMKIDESLTNYHLNSVYNFCEISLKFCVILEFSV